MSAFTRPASMLPSLLVTGTVDLPESPEGRALLFVECVAHGLIAWSALVQFHALNRASPLEWPRSFADSYVMLRLAVAMTNAFGDEPDCPAVTRTLAYHLLDRDPHPDLITLIHEALPRGVSLLLSPLSERLPS
jgi:hypothetical protein